MKAGELIPIEEARDLSLDRMLLRSVYLTEDERKQFMAYAIHVKTVAEKYMLNLRAAILSDEPQSAAIDMVCNGEWHDKTEFLKALHLPESEWAHANDVMNPLILERIISFRIFHYGARCALAPKMERVTRAPKIEKLTADEIAQLDELAESRNLTREETIIDAIRLLLAEKHNGYHGVSDRSARMTAREVQNAIKDALFKEDGKWLASFKYPETYKQIARKAGLSPNQYETAKQVCGYLHEAGFFAFDGKHNGKRYIDNGARYKPRHSALTLADFPQTTDDITTAAILKNRKLFERGSQGGITIYAISLDLFAPRGIPDTFVSEAFGRLVEQWQVTICDDKPLSPTGTGQPRYFLRGEGDEKYNPFISRITATTPVNPAPDVFARRAITKGEFLFKYEALIIDFIRNRFSAGELIEAEQITAGLNMPNDQRHIRLTRKLTKEIATQGELITIGPRGQCIRTAKEVKN